MAGVDAMGIRKSPPLPSVDSSSSAHVPPKTALGSGSCHRQHRRGRVEFPDILYETFSRAPVPQEMLYDKGCRFQSL